MLQPEWAVEFAVTLTQALTAASLGGGHSGALLENHRPKDNTACLLEHREKVSVQGQASASSLTEKALLSFLPGFGHCGCAWHLCLLAARAACRLTQAAILVADLPAFSCLELL